MKKNTIYKQVERAVKSGTILKPNACQRCNTITELHAHHWDYRMPLDVIWLCPCCHGKMGKKRHNESGKPIILKIETKPIKPKINGAKLMAARQRENVTRAELGIIAGVTHVRIWQIETETESHINVNVLNAIAKKLGVNPKDLQ